MNKKTLKRDKKTEHTISATIEKNNNSLIFHMSVLAICFLADLLFIWICFSSISHYTTYQNASYNCLLELQEWIFDTEDYIEGISSQPTYDVSYGKELYEKFAATIKGKMYGKVSDYLEGSDERIDEVVNALGQCINEGNPDKAAEIYENVVWAPFQQLQDSLAAAGKEYARMVEVTGIIVKIAIIIALLGSITMVIVIYRRTKKSGREVAKAITDPIFKVADLAESMAMGNINKEEIEQIDFDTITLDEAKRMLKAFQHMASNIAQDVDVVKRVADGDMTAFVNIRSKDDALGRNLYKMVQNNDMMFSHVAEIAESVTDQIGHIADANNNLADGCTKQMAIVSDFVEKIDGVSNLITETAQKTDECLSFANAVKSEVNISSQKMEDLKAAMAEIETSSQKISAVITNIEGIASQTNLLSLNASIEAARAGEAGRGFAVVAASIGELAKQSAELSQESKKLIEDTVNCTSRGSVIAEDTFEKFNIMNSGIDDIVAATEEITKRSVVQTDHMKALKEGIMEISDTVTQNAASSEETASMSDEIIRNSDELRKSIRQFNLRQRIPGHAYIPPEKANDQEFIEQANKNYERYQQSHK